MEKHVVFFATDSICATKKLEVNSTKLGTKEIEHLSQMYLDGRLYYSFNVLRSNRLRSLIIQDKMSEIGKIKSSTREFNLNADRKRFWLGRMQSIENKIFNESVPLSLNHFIF